MYHFAYIISRARLSTLSRLGQQRARLERELCRLCSVHTLSRFHTGTPASAAPLASKVHRALSARHTKPPVPSNFRGRRIVYPSRPLSATLLRISMHAQPCCQWSTHGPHQELAHMGPAPPPLPPVPGPRPPPPRGPPPPPAGPSRRTLASAGRVRRRQAPLPRLPEVGQGEGQAGARCGGTVHYSAARSGARSGAGSVPAQAHSRGRRRRRLHRRGTRPADDGVLRLGPAGRGDGTRGGGSLGPGTGGGTEGGGGAGPILWNLLLLPGPHHTRLPHLRLHRASRGRPRSKYHPLAERPVERIRKPLAD